MIEYSTVAPPREPVDFLDGSRALGAGRHGKLFSQGRLAHVHRGLGICSSRAKHALLAAGGQAGAQLAGGPVTYE